MQLYYQSHHYLNGHNLRPLIHPIQQLVLGPADLDKSAWFIHDISCEIAVIFPHICHNLD